MDKLTKKQIDARMEMYQEAIEHLDGDVCDTAVEREQANIVQQELRGIAEKFYVNATRE